MEKIDNSAEEEAVKDDAREFMSGLVGSGADAPLGCSSSKGAEIVKAWKSAYSAGKDTAMLDSLWKSYDPEATSIWKMTYDEADSIENLEDATAIVTNLLSQDGMKTDATHANCLGVIHTLDCLEIEGLWLFNGPDPEQLFAANSETSWYSWSQLGPEATDLVKKAVADMLKPEDGKFSGKAIKDTQVY